MKMKNDSAFKASTSTLETENNLYQLVKSPKLKYPLHLK